MDTLYSSSQESAAHRTYISREGYNLNDKLSSSRPLILYPERMMNTQNMPASQKVIECEMKQECRQVNLSCIEVLAV